LIACRKTTSLPTPGQNTLQWNHETEVYWLGMVGVRIVRADRLQSEHRCTTNADGGYIAHTRRDNYRTSSDQYVNVVPNTDPNPNYHAQGNGHCHTISHTQLNGHAHRHADSDRQSSAHRYTDRDGYLYA